MNYIVIPEKLEGILKKDPFLHSIVEQTAASFSKILYESKLFFFEEYTDHGSDHIQKVLRAAEDIITPETLELLSSKDVAVLVLSVFLHDIGMHTEFSTFKSLVEEKAYDDCRETILDQKCWNEIWEDYLDEAKKFSGKQRFAIFGDETVEYRRPSLFRKDDLSGSDRKLIGEFIRRYHPRLAYEIGFKGIIGSNGQVIEFAVGLPKMLRQLSAIVARSHGINIRDTYQYLESIGDKAWKRPDQVNVIFLMVVIRIADYFQFGSNRVNPETLKIKTFSSPISIFEHKKHLAIDFIQPDDVDQETLFVKSNPTSGLMYIRLKSLFKDIQHELDLSWAVLGETYGNFQLDRQLKIRYRRIDSNLNSVNLLRSISYIPEEIKFKSDADLPKLLVAPLYGNDPSYGVREMTQNAVDACKEREFEEKEINTMYFPKIQMGIITENQNTFFIVRDNGKGMNLLELKNYFLKAGASFRKSLDWQLKYTNDEGEPKIQRNGKFGVGVLSTFLLGNEIYVETRSMHDGVGYSFTAKIDSEQIEITKRDDLEVGTFIKILINNVTVDSLNAPKSKTKKWYQWYVLKSPLIEYIGIPVLDSKSVAPYLPNYEDSLPNVWHSFKPRGFNKVMWTYDENYRSKAFSCNGILIPSNIDLPTKYPNKASYDGYSKIINRMPIISIFDYKGTLPLTLNRNSIDGQLPFSIDLVREIYKDFIASLLCFKPNSNFIDNEMRIVNESFIHPSFADPNTKLQSHLDNIIYLSEGFMYDYGYFRKYIKKKLITLFSKKDELVIELADSYKNGYAFKFEVENKVRLSYNWNLSDPAYNGGGRVTMPKSSYLELFDPNKNRVRKGLKQEHIVEIETDGWVTYSTLYKEKLNEELISNILINKSIISIKETSVNERQSHDMLDNLIKHYLKDDLIIPYDMAQRRKKFYTAYEELAEYCAKYKNE
ncbi:HD domain-containing protein [Spirosoma linguale]|uniref:Molecular chaperone HSP90 family-like protein n=1 Tax=Spirosoma linguale (strain ATCC 33905 / DSM 74 / LMG 10896 / Claus 1) TaxID=504472 RepID=D2QS92_SPILD|nr:Molecular chaperone HSP90 family-like protein [Spirosoma linguale DSM 74]